MFPDRVKMGNTTYWVSINDLNILWMQRFNLRFNCSSRRTIKDLKHVVASNVVAVLWKQTFGVNFKVREWPNWLFIQLYKCLWSCHRSKVFIFMSTKNARQWVHAFDYIYTGQNHIGLKVDTYTQISKEAFWNPELRASSREPLLGRLWV